MSVGEKIKSLRKARGMTQTELGERVGVQKNAVSKWECGRVDVPTPTLKALAALFDVPMSTLLEEQAPNPGNDSSDVLDEVDVAFYGEYRALSEDDKDTIRDMVRLMRERRSKRQE
ncbi:MAG: helix-turn-helix transcriptional regulator [Oscillospiraceae bacterium]|nr:helix-turn-helix transcriptional regulator [Oscillospiraceae bacterium]MBR2889698.1 helix-turn-helix transcriptional regulator [Oscillospiraceae bacterium]